MKHSTGSGPRQAAVLALTFAVAAAASAVLAQSDTIEPTAAQYICRPALADESGNARMMVSSTSLVCRPFAVTLHMTTDGSYKTIGSVRARPLTAPDFSQALTPLEVTRTYNQWVLHALDIDPATEHTP